MAFLLMLSKKSGYTTHSVHHTRERALMWKECKEHEGEECSIVEITREILDDLQAFKPVDIARRTT